jgi:hypothetical protein
MNIKGFAIRFRNGILEKVLFNLSRVLNAGLKKNLLEELSVKYPVHIRWHSWETWK